MDASSFICALRRIFTFRGPVSILKCDRGTNFMGEKSELRDALREMNQGKVHGYVKDHGLLGDHVRVDIQPITRLTFWWRLGAPNRFHSP